MVVLYLSLTYEEYKELEKEIEKGLKLEKISKPFNNQSYYKYFRIKIGKIILEVHGPLIKLEEADES